MYQSLINTEETFLEKLQTTRKNHLLELKTKVEINLKKLNEKMVYDDVKILNKDVEYIMKKLIWHCAYDNGMKIALKCSEDSVFEGLKLITGQYKKMKIDDNNFKIGFWKYFERAIFILATSLSEKTGIKFEQDSNIKPGISIVKENGYYYLNIWWL